MSTNKGTHGGRRNNAGRKSGDAWQSKMPSAVLGERRGARDEWVAEDHIKDTYVWAETDNRVVIYSWDDDKRAKRDQAAKLLHEIGITLHIVPVDSVVETQKPRRRWSSRRVPITDICAHIIANPGLTGPQLARKTYLLEGETWTDPQERQAINRFYLTVRPLLKKGAIVRRYNEAGYAIYFAKNSPGLENYSATRAKRLTQVIDNLTPEQQAEVRRFVKENL